jgi:hypothetical protein
VKGENKEETKDQNIRQNKPVDHPSEKIEETADLRESTDTATMKTDPFKQNQSYPTIIYEFQF